MERAQSGDREAYRMLLESVLPDLRGFLRRRVRDADEVEDLLQDVLLTLHRARHTYDPARAFEPWLFAIARHAAVDRFRASRARRRFELPVADAAELGATSEDRGEVSLETAFASLPDAQREALEMVKIEGLTMEEAAKRAGISSGALRVRIHRGYRALRKRLSGGG
jgi:RNA polymerase sigma-70 factor (ECF subfamily)